MTGMMAFFLVMGLTSHVSQDTKKGVSHYFDPIGMTEVANGVGGVLGGKTTTIDDPSSRNASDGKNQPSFRI